MSGYRNDARRLHDRICDQGFYTESNRADMQTITMMMQVEILDKLDRLQGQFNAMSERLDKMEEQQATRKNVPKVKMGGPQSGR